MKIHWQEVEVAPHIFGPVCPACGCLVVRELKERHEQWHEELVAERNEE